MAASTNSRFRRLIAVAAVCLTAGGVAQGASAATFDIQTGGGTVADGWATATGTITFLNGSSANIDTSITDRCDSGGNGDEYGAYLFVQKNAAGNPWIGPVAWDNNGCGSGAVRMITGVSGGTVTRLRVQLRECDDPAPAGGALDCSGAAIDTATSAWKDNPLN